MDKKFITLSIKVITVYNKIIKLQHLTEINWISWLLGEPSTLTSSLILLRAKADWLEVDSLTPSTVIWDDQGGNSGGLASAHIHTVSIDGFCIM